MAWTGHYGPLDILSTIPEDEFKDPSERITVVDIQQPLYRYFSSYINYCRSRRPPDVYKKSGPKGPISGILSRSSKLKGLKNPVPGPSSGPDPVRRIRSRDHSFFFIGCISDGPEGIN